MNRFCTRAVRIDTHNLRTRDTHHTRSRAHTHTCTLMQACLDSHVIVTGVPDPKFNLPMTYVRPGQVVVNVATDPNVDQEAIMKIPGVKYVPLVGKVTISMLEKNIMRLYSNFHAPGVQTSE